MLTETEKSKYHTQPELLVLNRKLLWGIIIHGHRMVFLSGCVFVSAETLCIGKSKENHFKFMPEIAMITELGLSFLGDGQLVKVFNTQLVCFLPSALRRHP